MTSWDGKSKGTSTGYRIFIWVLKTFGLRPAYVLLRFVAAWYLLFAGTASVHLLYFFKKLGYSAAKSRRLLYRNFCAFGEAIIDRISIMAGVPNQFSFQFNGEEYLREMTRAGKGGLLISAHLGNWEIAGFLLKRLETRIHIVMYDAEHREIKEEIDQFTGGRNANIILVKDDLSHIYAISEALERNELVCMHADRFIGESKTLKINFLSEEARFPAGPFLMASMFHVPVSFTFAFKRSSRHYDLSATPLHYCPKGEGSQGIRRLAENYVQVLEEMARRYPEQWYNYYAFWKA